jgi:hypothetical protein
MSDPSQAAQATFTAHELILPALAGIASFVAAWVAARLALRNFYQERIWERKATAYTAVFEALHSIERWHQHHFDASVEGREISEEQKKTLQIEANKAEQDLEKCLAGQVWILPQFYNRSLRLTQDLRKIATTERIWDKFLQRSLQLISGTTRYLGEKVREDLGVNDGTKSSLCLTRWFMPTNGADGHRIIMKLPSYCPSISAQRSAIESPPLFPKL